MKTKLFLFLTCMGCGSDKSENEEIEKLDTGDTQSTSHEFQSESTVCGEVSVESDCSLPNEISIWTIKDGFYACNEGFSDTAGNWEDWRDELVETVSVDSNGYFEANLPAGDYASSSDNGCYGCDSFTVSDGECTNVNITMDEIITVDAPNIYLYPEQPTATHVRIENPQEITITDPEYDPKTGWWSLAYPDGQLLTQDGWKDFLFYELAMDGRQFQREEGWCATGKRAQLSVESSMAQYGFNGPEIDDFSEFWDSEFPTSKSYTIYPQTEGLRRLDISPKPDSFLRVWFLIENGCNSNVRPVEIPHFKAEGFVATEWGVLFSGGLKGPKVIVTGL